MSSSLREDSEQSQLQDMWVPDVEVREEGNQVRVHVDVPGVPKDNVKVDIQEGMLTIQGERNEERNEEQLSRKGISPRCRWPEVSPAIGPHRCYR